MVMEKCPLTPLTPKEIWNLIEKENLKEISGSSSAQACLSTMLNANSKGSDSVFYRVAGRPGYYGLMSSLPAEAVVLELDEDEMELSVDDEAKPSAKTFTERRKEKGIYVRLPDNLKWNSHSFPNSDDCGHSLHENDSLAEAKVLSAAMTNGKAEEKEALDFPAPSRRGKRHANPYGGGQLHPYRRRKKRRLMQYVMQMKPNADSLNAETNGSNTSKTNCSSSFASLSPSPSSQGLSNHSSASPVSGGLAETTSGQNLRLSSQSSGIQKRTSEDRIYSVKPRRRSQHKLSAAAQLRQTREGCIDLETPNSILVNTNLKALINKHSFDQLPLADQLKLNQLLPECDRVFDSDGFIQISRTALDNEFFTKACMEWRTRLEEGEFMPENQIRRKHEEEKEQTRVDHWKIKHFESSWGEKVGLVEDDEQHLEKVSLETNTYGPVILLKTLKRHRSKLASKRPKPTTVNPTSRILTRSTAANHKWGAEDQSSDSSKASLEMKLKEFSDCRIVELSPKKVTDAHPPEQTTTCKEEEEEMDGNKRVSTGSLLLKSSNLSLTVASRDNTNANGSVRDSVSLAETSSALDVACRLADTAPTSAAAVSVESVAKDAKTACVNPGLVTSAASESVISIDESLMSSCVAKSEEPSFQSPNSLLSSSLAVCSITPLDCLSDASKRQKNETTQELCKILVSLSSDSQIITCVSGVKVCHGSPLLTSSVFSSRMTVPAASSIPAHSSADPSLSLTPKLHGVMQTSVPVVSESDSLSVPPSTPTPISSICANNKTLLQHLKRPITIPSICDQALGLRKLRLSSDDRSSSAVKSDGLRGGQKALIHLPISKLGNAPIHEVSSANSSTAQNELKSIDVPALPNVSRPLSFASNMPTSTVALLHFGSSSEVTCQVSVRGSVPQSPVQPLVGTGGKCSSSPRIKVPTQTRTLAQLKAKNKAKKLAVMAANSAGMQMSNNSSSGSAPSPDSHRLFQQRLAENLGSSDVKPELESIKVGVCEENKLSCELTGSAETADLPTSATTSNRAGSTGLSVCEVATAAAAASRLSKPVSSDHFVVRPADGYLGGEGVTVDAPPQKLKIVRVASPSGQMTYRISNCMEKKDSSETDSCLNDFSDASNRSNSVLLVTSEATAPDKGTSPSASNFLHQLTSQQQQQQQPVFFQHSISVPIPVTQSSNRACLTSVSLVSGVFSMVASGSNSRPSVPWGVNYSNLPYAVSKPRMSVYPGTNFCSTQQYDRLSSNMQNNLSYSQMNSFSRLCSPPFSQPNSAASLPSRLLSDIDGGMADEDSASCACNRRAMVVCRKCGAFCHNDCIGPSKLCVTCLVTT